ncbi:hypothetical protein [Vagococcus silagei]|uniref:Uncharacterized protein n=1 Tax=Vagococcus silagei TaxID=2508885 RepID=A0A4S3B888_9ENTE|nr:hypothetical protein ESZ54_00005 [Vagococcus silagei]
MLSETMVAGTVILNKQNGDKEFLVKEDHGKFNFLTVTIDSEFTSLACILKELKTFVQLNTREMELEELTNLTIGTDSMPLFVFSLDEEESNALPDSFYWKKPSTIRDEVLEKITVSGVPFFS